MKQCWRLYALVALLLPLALAIAGCGDTYYNIQNGKLTQCGDQFSNDTNTHCGNSYYVSFDGGQTFRYCPSPVISAYQCNPATPPAVASSATSCTPNWTYDQLVNKGTAWYVVDRLQDTNNFPSSSQVQFTSTASKTVTMTDQQQVTLNASLGLDDAITLGIRKQFSTSVTKSVQVAVGTNVTVTVPAHQTAYAIYGAEVQITSGHLYDPAKCEPNWDYGTDLTTVPFNVGWCYWLSSQPDPCPTVN